MDWLPVASIAVLSVAVFVLAQTVVVLVARSKRAGRQLRPGPVPQGHLDAREAGSLVVPAPDRLAASPLAADAPPLTHPMGFRNARRQFTDAFMRGDAKSAIATLPELKRVLGIESSAYLLSVGALAGAGEAVDLQPLLDAINSNAPPEDAVLQAIITGAVQHYVSADREQEGLDQIEKALDRIVSDAARPDSLRAAIANQLQMLYFGVGDAEKALRVATVAIGLSPDEPSYHYNLSMIYEESGDLEKAVAAIERCMDLGKKAPNRTHFIQAWDLYRQCGDQAKMDTMQHRIDAVGNRALEP